MNAEDSRQQYDATSEFDWSRIGLTPPPWYLRLRMSWVENEIHEVERRLDEEFGVCETTPLVEEHCALVGARDALMRRLTRAEPATADH